MKNNLRKIRTQFIKMAMLGLVIALFATSCVKNYTFQKVVVNNSEHAVEINYGCCDSETVTIVPAFEEKIVFQCAYESANPPSCDDVNGKCSLVSQAELKTKDIGDAANWFTETNGKTVKCVFTIDPTMK